MSKRFPVRDVTSTVNNGPGPLCRVRDGGVHFVRRFAALFSFCSVTVRSGVSTCGCKAEIRRVLKSDLSWSLLSQTGPVWGRRQRRLASAVTALVHLCTNTGLEIFKWFKWKRRSGVVATGVEGEMPRMTDWSIVERLWKIGLRVVNREKKLLSCIFPSRRSFLSRFFSSVSVLILHVKKIEAWDLNLKKYSWVFWLNIERIFRFLW